MRAEKALLPYLNSQLIITLISQITNTDKKKIIIQKTLLPYLN